MIVVPAQLSEVDFARIRFCLEFQEPASLGGGALLRLRKDLRRAAASTLPGEVARALFDPPLLADPQALRRFQRPGPPFALQFPLGADRHLDAGDRFELPVLFLGGGLQLLESFALTLQSLGPVGLFRGEGRFELAEISAEDPAGNRSRLWREGQPLAQLAPPLCDAHWWVDEPQSQGAEVRLEFLTPARLLSGGRPLFRADFVGLFPFIMRRVSSMLFVHCGVEVVEDPQALLRTAEQVRVLENRLFWEDWRQLEGPERSQELGGIRGHLRLQGSDLGEIGWLLKLGSLLNLGKGASFGAGRFRLLNG